MIALQTEIYFGNLIRNLHHWSGNLMVVVGVLHLLRVFYTAGFTPPREFNWVMGIIPAFADRSGQFHRLSAALGSTGLLGGDSGHQPVGLHPPDRGAPDPFTAGRPRSRRGDPDEFLRPAYRPDPPGDLWDRLLPHLAGAQRHHHCAQKNQPGTDKEKVTTIPHLVSIEFVFALVWLALLIAWSAFVNAPLEEAANPAHSPNPAKAAWYFMGFQELLLHFHPVFGAIIIPGIGLLALILLPYLDQDMEHVGVWFRSAGGDGSLQD